MPEYLADPEFGLARQIGEPIKTGKGRTQIIQTYRLNYDQSMVVAARLSPRTLIRLVKDWKETKEELHRLKIGNISKRKQIEAMTKLHNCIPAEVLVESQH